MFSVATFGHMMEEHIDANQHETISRWWMVVSPVFLIFTPTWENDPI